MSSVGVDDSPPSLIWSITSPGSPPESSCRYTSTTPGPVKATSATSALPNLVSSLGVNWWEIAC